MLAPIHARWQQGAMGRIEWPDVGLWCRGTTLGTQSLYSRSCQVRKRFRWFPIRDEYAEQGEASCGSDMRRPSCAAESVLRPALELRVTRPSHLLTVSSNYPRARVPSAQDERRIAYRTGTGSERDLAFCASEIDGNRARSHRSTKGQRGAAGRSA